MKITDLPKHERPREKMIEKGPTGLKDKELMAILIRIGHDKKNAIELSQEILKKHPMKKLLAMSYEEMVCIKGIDADKLNGIELTDYLIITKEDSRNIC